MPSRTAARTRELIDLMDRIEPGAPPVLSVVSGAIGDHVGADFDVSYGLSSVDDCDHVTFLYTSAAAPAPLAGRFRQVVAASRRTWKRAPERIPRPERNQVLLGSTVARILERILKMKPEDQPIVRDVLRPLGVRDQMRVVLCDGPAMLALVAVLRGAGRDFGDCDRRRLCRLVPSLRRRLIFERTMGDRDLFAGAFLSALEHFAAPALLVGPGGQVRHANAAGRAWMKVHGRAAYRELNAALGGRSPGMEVRPVSAPGWPAYALVTVGSAAMTALSVDQRADAAGQRWGLTPRQRDVLRLLAHGKTNKAISATLGIAEITVEVHVSAVLRRASARSRAELIARLLGG
jgi:DNA-binding CsgD family transcriptional regulator